MYCDIIWQQRKCWKQWTTAASRCLVRVVTFSLCFIVAFVLSSCRSDDVTPATDEEKERPISFNAAVSVSMETRAAGDGELTNAALQASGFGVYCWYTGTSAFNNNPSAAIDMLMRNQKVTYDATASDPAWTYNPPKYWPKNQAELLTFRAYAPYVSYNLPTDNNGMPQLPVIVSDDDYHNGTQHDPVWGTGKFADSELFGALYNDVTYTNNGVIDWYFHHGMAKLIFKGQMVDDGSDMTVNITSITLTPLYNQGLLDISSPATSEADEPVWNDRDGALTVTILGDDLDQKAINQLEMTQLTSDERGLLIIPHEYSTMSPLTLTVTYETEDGREVTMSAPITQDFKGNTVYTFHMTVSNSLTVVIEAVNAAFTPWVILPSGSGEIYNW